MKQFGPGDYTLSPPGFVGVILNYVLGARMAHAGEATPTPFRSLKDLAIRLSRRRKMALSMLKKRSWRRRRRVSR